MNVRKYFLILAAVAAGSTVYADKVSLTQTPAAVQQAIRSRSGRHTVEDIDRDVKNGKTTYEASWKDQAGAQQELLVSENGQILRDVPNGAARDAKSVARTNSIAGFTGGQQAPLNWASETAQNKLRSLANGASIDSFQKGQFQGKTAYQAAYKMNGREVMLVLGEDGTVLASSPANLAGVATGAVTTTTTTKSGPTIAGFTGAQSAPMNWASEAVQNKFKQMANGATIDNFQKGQFQGRTAFEGSWTQNGQTTTVIVADDGTVMSSSPTAAGRPPTAVTGSN